MVSIPFRADTVFERGKPSRLYEAVALVSIPFRADTVFELQRKELALLRAELVSIPFRADTVFELKTSFDLLGKGCLYVSIPFRADTVFEQSLQCLLVEAFQFQSLSGLTLCLNDAYPFGERKHWPVSIPFRADTVFELQRRWGNGMADLPFQSLSGLTLCLNSLPFFPCKINNLATHFREPICFRLFSSPIQHAPRKINTGNFL